MSILKIKNLSHAYSDEKLFDNIDLVVNKGERLAILGLNGAGKTTFMDILSKRLPQDQGEVTWLNGIRWGYLDQHTVIDKNLSVMEYLKTAFAYMYEKEAAMNAMYEDMDSATGSQLEKLIERTAKIQDYLILHEFYDLEAKIKKVANGLGVNGFGYDTNIRKLSGGQRAKLMLSKLLLEELDVMLLDEPTNFLDVEHIEWLVNYLNSADLTFLVVSHDMDFIDKIARGIVSIENGIVRKYTGNYTQYIEQYEMVQRQYKDDYERQQREIKKMQDYIDKNKARAATAGMANSRKKMLDKIKVIAKPKTIYPARFTFPTQEILTKNLLKVENLTIGYDNKPLLSDINLAIQSDTKLWLRGINGIGKTTFIKTILDKINSISGSYKFHQSTSIAYIDQELEFDYRSNLLPTDYLSNLYPKMNRKKVREELAKVGIKNELATRAICDMSGGEQVRVKLCALCQIPSNLLILDEPTNHLDVIAKQSLMEALKEYKGAVILVSHEPNFANEICNMEVVLQ